MNISFWQYLAATVIFGILAGKGVRWYTKISNQ